VRPSLSVALPNMCRSRRHHEGRHGESLARRHANPRAYPSFKKGPTARTFRKADRVIYCFAGKINAG